MAFWVFKELVWYFVPINKWRCRDNDDGVCIVYLSGIDSHFTVDLTSIQGKTTEENILLNTSITTVYTSLDEFNLNPTSAVISKLADLDFRYLDKFSCSWSPIIQVCMSL